MHAIGGIVTDNGLKITTPECVMAHRFYLCKTGVVTNLLAIAHRPLESPAARYTAVAPLE
jgi:hypothetical protein